MRNRESPLFRRDLLKVGIAVSAGVMLSSGGRAFAAGSDKIRVAMVGCGDRGTKDAIDCLKSDPGLEYSVVLAEVLPDRLAGSLERLKKAAAGQVKLTPETSFVGFDAYRKVMALQSVDAPCCS